MQGGSMQMARVTPPKDRVMVLGILRQSKARWAGAMNNDAVCLKLDTQTAADGASARVWISSCAFLLRVALEGVDGSTAR